MEKIFNYYIEKKELIIGRDLIERGWKKLDLDIGGEAYEKGNFWVTFQNQDGHRFMTVICRDPTLLEWMPYSPEQFRIFIKHPTIEAFETIMNFI